MRQSVKLGITAVAAAAALFGGASTASASSGDKTDPGACENATSTQGTQVTCQFGDDDENVTINQTFNINIQDIDGSDIDDVTFGPDLI